ncbi:hypothetical protein Hanom_Chr05g00421881 [Helianthus anomalus]
MSSKASVTELVILDAWTRFLDVHLQLLLVLAPLQLLHSSNGTPFFAFILARHFPVKMLLIFIDPSALPK